MNLFESDSNTIMYIFVGLLLLLYALLSVLKKTKQKQSGAIDFSAYQLRESVLTKNEKEFYEILKVVVRDNQVILSKVRLADIFEISKGKGSQSALNRIHSRHVDFLICQNESLRPLFAIELDDKSHERSDRVKRDDFVNQLFEKTELPLIRFRAKYRYTRDELSSGLTPILNNLDHD